MMRDVRDILSAFDALLAERVPMALATIVAVEGSSYRRPGARMLIAADGRKFGTVSGGCLEADVARRGRGVIDSGEPVLCRYETGEDLEEIISLDNVPAERDPGLSLGCGGALEILIAPVSDDSIALRTLKRSVCCGRRARLATVYRTGGSVGLPIGYCFELPLYDTCCPSLDDSMNGGGGGPLDSTHHLLALTFGRVDGFHRLFVDKGWIDALIESFQPAPHLIILGDGPDTVPLIQLAQTQGWRTTIAGYGNVSTAGDAFIPLLDHAEERLQIDPTAAVVVMTHNLLRDARLLRELVKTPPTYVGVLGPLHRTQRLLKLADIHAADFVGRLFAPVGLDLGGEGSQSVALSIVAEIAAVFSRHAGGHLRNKAAGIHQSRLYAEAAVHL